MRVDELVAERTEHSATYAMPDGTFETVVSVVPMHARQDGRWVPVDTELVERGRGWSPRAVSYGLVLPDTAQGPVAFGDEASRIEMQLLEGGESPAQAGRSERGAQPARPAPARAAGPRAEYRQTFDGVDVSWTALPGGVKEEVVLQD